jgi:hypothetical protein
MAGLFRTAADLPRHSECLLRVDTVEKVEIWK